MITSRIRPQHAERISNGEAATESGGIVLIAFIALKNLIILVNSTPISPPSSINQKSTRKVMISDNCKVKYHIVRYILP